MPVWLSGRLFCDMSPEAALKLSRSLSPALRRETYVSISLSSVAEARQYEKAKKMISPEKIIVTTMTLMHDSTFIGRGQDPARAVDIVERLWVSAFWGDR